MENDANDKSVSEYKSASEAAGASVTSPINNSASSSSAALIAAPADASFGANSETRPAQIVTAAGDAAMTAQSAQTKQEPPKDPFIIPPPPLPTQEGPEGILYDFNDGARVCLPQGKWHVNIEDAQSDNILFSTDCEGGWVVSTKKYFVNFRIKVWKQGQSDPLLDHTLDLKGKEVIIKFPVGTLGDIIGWMPYAEKFYLKHKCALEVFMAQNMAELFAPQYPQLFLSHPPDGAKFKKPYASYRVGLFFRGNLNDQPIDFRQVGLHRTAGYILGVDPKEEPPRINLNYPRKIKEPYVCIATKSSCQAKLWNNGYGWETVVKYLKDLGYRVLCIDREPVIGHNFVWNRMPHDAEDFTGNLSLQERVALLQHADFFIGLGSGLSWLAWCAKIPIVLISGFSLPICEFETPYRVYSSHGCKGCWDDVNCNFDHHDFFWCPRHKGTDRQYECTRLITGKQVIWHINNLMQDYNLRGGGGGYARLTFTKGDITHIAKGSDFYKNLTELVREHNPKTIIETGTFQGRGTTAAVCEGIKTLKNKCVFYSIESNPYNYKTAVENLKSDGNLSYVEVLNGISLPRGILPAIDEIRETTADENIKSDIFVDYPKSIRAECYFNETNYPALPDDLLGECLKKCNYKPDIVILDSAGHLGFIEFKYVVEALRGNCIVVLDDTLHIKHSKSLELIKTDKRFKIIVESDEKFGFCIASFTP